jgi:hypothetical protein
MASTALLACAVVLLALLAWLHCRLKKLERRVDGELAVDLLEALRPPSGESLAMGGRAPRGRPREKEPRLAGEDADDDAAAGPAGGADPCDSPGAGGAGPPPDEHGELVALGAGL